MSQFSAPVSIEISTSAYSMFANQNYQAWTALGEFVDNSVSSWLSNQIALETLHGPDFKLKIHIQYNPDDGGRLAIKDNAAGISVIDYQRAFSLATPPTDKTKINQFGVGMKAAACWFARNWTVRTSALNEPVEKTLEWNVETIISEQTINLTPKVKGVGEKAHFTEIVMTKLNHPITGSKTIAKIKQHLTKMYRKFLAGDKIEIYWNDEILVVKPRAILNEPYFKDPSSEKIEWKLPFEFTLRSGQVVSGEARLLETMDKQETSLNYFWRNRLIKGNFEPFHRPKDLYGEPSSFRTGRLCIDLYLDQFKPTTDKQDINFADSGASEEDLIDAIKAQLSTDKFNILRQGENYRANKIDPNDKAQYNLELERASAKLEDGIAPLIDDPTTAEEAPEDPYPCSDGRACTIERRLSLIIDGEPWSVKIGYGDNLNDTELVRVTEEPQGINRNLAVAIGMNHPFIKQYWSIETSAVLVRLIVGLVCAEWAAKAGGAIHSSLVRWNLSQILKEVFSDGNGQETT